MLNSLVLKNNVVADANTSLNISKNVSPLVSNPSVSTLDLDKVAFSKTQGASNVTQYSSNDVKPLTDETKPFGENPDNQRSISGKLKRISGYLLIGIGALLLFSLINIMLYELTAPMFNDSKKSTT